ncbi:hypothetical protein DFH09DRAFT_1265814, partial [Mycena vulgaris]
MRREVFECPQRRRSMYWMYRRRKAEQAAIPNSWSDSAGGHDGQTRARRVLGPYRHIMLRFYSILLLANFILFSASEAFGLLERSEP